MKDDQVHNEELEEHINREANPAKGFGVVQSLGELQSHEHNHKELDLLEPKVDVEMFTVSFSYAVSEPWAVVVVC